MLSLHKHLSNSGNHPNPLDQLLTPSWISGLLGVVVSVAIVIGSVGLLHFRSSDFNIIAHQQKDKPAQITDYQTIDTSITANTLVSDIPLFIFWAGVGVVAYSFTAAIINALRSAVELEEEMTYVNASRRELLLYAVERLVIRLSALITWFIYLNYTLHLIIPYAIAVGFAGTSETNWLRGGLYLLGGIAVLLVTSHAHTILLRLIALRPRLFG